MQESRGLFANCKIFLRHHRLRLVFSLYSIVDGLFWPAARRVCMSAVNLAVPFMNVLFSISVLFAVVHHDYAIYWARAR